MKSKSRKYSHRLRPYVVKKMRGISMQSIYIDEFSFVKKKKTLEKILRNMHKYGDAFVKIKMPEKKKSQDSKAPFYMER